MFQHDVLTAADPSQHPDAENDIVWHHPSRPIRICLQGGIGPALAGKAVAAFKGQNPSEVGGLLFGKVETHGPDVEITLTSTVFVGGESPLFNSTPNDLAALTRALGRDCDPDSKPIGYFRSDIRDQSALTTQDKEFVDRTLPIPNSVSLLIRPLQSGVCMVGAFLWKHNRVQRDSMDFAMPLFAPDSQESDEPAARPASHPAAPADGVSVSLRRGSPSPMKAEEGKATTTNALLGLLIGATVCLCVLVVVLLAFLSHRFASQPAPQAVPASLTAAPVQKQAAAVRGLDLQVSRPAPDQFNITWERELPPDAARGQLTIFDGSDRRLLTLDSAQLRLSKLTYFSNHSEVSFRLDVLSSSNTSLMSEYIRVLGTRPQQASTTPGALKPMPVPPKAASLKAVPPKVRDVRLPAATPEARHTTRTQQAEVAMTSPRPQQHAPAANAGTKPEAGRTEGPAPQPTIRQTPPTGAAAGLQPAPTQKEAVNPVPNSTALAGFNPAQPLQRVMPRVHEIFPNGFPSAKRVAVDVTISPTGKVTEANTTEPFGLLSVACVTAAKQWSFTPALRNQRPVESHYHIVFVFNARK